jgi:hypothetical protein
MMAIILY